MSIQIFQEIEKIGHSNWSSMAQISPATPTIGPFLNYHFLQALEESGAIGGNSGQHPYYFHLDSPQDQGVLFTFRKDHSYGEYIFDWDWAHSYQKLHLPYYPKLTSMIPYTPVNTPHFLGKGLEASTPDRLLGAYEEFYRESNFHSSHFLFLPQKEHALFQDQGHLLRKSIQFHFFNEDYACFEEFLQKLKPKKAKQIRKERIFPHLRIEQLTGNVLGPRHAQEMYQFYLATISQKQAIAYLNLKFFQLIFESMKDNILYVRAVEEEEEEAIAGALFFYDSQTLYGRYWGCKIHRPNLHFELCLYQGIDFCIQNKLKVFEAGAQGEHKITRGFRPIFIYSAHKLKNPLFYQAIESYITREGRHLEMLAQELSTALPFKGEGRSYQR